MIRIIIKNTNTALVVERFLSIITLKSKTDESKVYYYKIIVLYYGKRNIFEPRHDSNSVVRRIRILYYYILIYAYYVRHVKV